MEEQMVRELEDIASKIKKQRAGLGLSQAAMAKLLKISAPAYCKIENGQTDLNISRLMQICKVLKTTPTELFATNYSQSANKEEVLSLKKDLLLKEEELNKLRKKVIDLYDKLGM
ncbi:transcriptional regulator with XRE-family HTH domain [Pedobacter sp. UYP30]|uniref:helix-turn-helix domain-containing protein n=1 Tax=Pedobacter sp. UYP30 TaxID=1756400 RepID=UPI003396ECBD